MDKKDFTQSSMILDKLLQCNTQCGGNFAKTTFIYEEDLIEWLFKNLPTAKYVVDRITNYIFSNGLTTGDEKQDEILNEFLYTDNIQGTTNYSVIREAVRNALIYRKSGIRYVSDEAGLINVTSKTYSALTQENEEYYGFDDIVAYLISTDGRKMHEKDTKELEFDKDLLFSKGILYDKDKKLIVISKDEFVNLRSNPTLNEGESALAFDKQRTRLLTTIYERMNYDLEYDGPGRLMLRLKDNYASGGDNEIGTAEVLDQTVSAQNDRAEDARKEAVALGEAIKESKSDSVIVYSNMFEKFDHLPRTTKSTEFFKYLDNEGIILAQVIGVSPTLVGLGKLSGNVSMEKIIDNDMLNDIVPMREKFAVQISAMLAEKIGVDKIYFDKYEMKQNNDENDKRLKVVNIIQRLRQSGDNKLADKFVAMLDEEITPDGKIARLKNTIATKIKKLLRRKKDGKKHGGVTRNNKKRKADFKC